MTLTQQLFENRDEKYASFQSGLVPTLEKEKFIGVRVPLLRKIERNIRKSEEAENFIHTLPHTYYDENLLHSIIISEMRDFDRALCEVNRFLPFVDNWAVCDTLRPKAFAKNTDALLPEVKRWISSPETYTCRFGIDMLMTYYLDLNFREEYLRLPSLVRSEEYYVNMMTAWYYATALAKHWEKTLPYLENGMLTDTVRNMTIRKACESLRITKEQKEYLKKLKNEKGEQKNA